MTKGANSKFGDARILVRSSVFNIRPPLLGEGTRMGSNGIDNNFCLDLGVEWSEGEYDELMLCLREDGASVQCMCCAGVWILKRGSGEGLLKCMDKYLVQDRVPVRKMLKAFGKEIVCPVPPFRECIQTEGSAGPPRGNRGVHGSETAECYASGVSALERVLVWSLIPSLGSGTEPD